MRAGLRDELISQVLERELAELQQDRVERAELDPAEAAERISRFVQRALARVMASGPLKEHPAEQAELANRLLKAMSAEERLALPPELLAGIRPQASSRLVGEARLPPRPQVPLSASDLLVNGAGQPSIGSELKSEIQSAERVDLICAFVIWSGVRILREQLEQLTERGGRLRVITTTYMAATEPRALIALGELGAEIRLAYDAQSTKLHAKSWLLERPAELTTAFVGSSNLSHTALHDGLEWNVRLSATDSPQLIERIRATFETHWQSEHFEPFNPDDLSDRKRLRKALGQNEGRRAGQRVSFVGLEVHPHPFQARMLEALTVERERHDRHQNLLVAATGTGKTVVSALDYRGLRAKSGEDLSLLFVAHRDRILDQSRATFQQVLRLPSFGEILGGGSDPIVGKHVFAMVQSLTEERLAELEPDAYDVVIVDEFHHAAAPSYRRLLEHLAPRELLGLTATPERMDEQNITNWFGGRIAVELRLWEAIDEGYLVPFQYFGVSDGTDLSRLEWRRGGYSDSDLEGIYTADDGRVVRLLSAIERIVNSDRLMRALGFCVSIEHAKFMARKFDDAGLPAVAISGATPDDERDEALERLSRRDLRVVFSVDVLGEGVDVPDVDTILLLRPTQSATVLSQQLGRGLRHAEGKSCLTVIDMIGQQHRRFRFDRRLEAIVDARNGSVRKQAEEGFPLMPSGCDIDLDRDSQEVILANLKAAASLGSWRTLVENLQTAGDVGLSEFLTQTERPPEDVYRPQRGSWTRLRRDAGLATPTGGDDEDALLRSVGRLLHVDDRDRIGLYSDVLSAPVPPQERDFDPRQRRQLLMLHFALWGTSKGRDGFASSWAAVWREEAVRAEIVELLAVLDERSDRISVPLGLEPRIPLSVHARYTRDEVLAAVGEGTIERPPQLREGVRWVPEENLDLFFVTLQKSERNYSPTTMYRDYAVSPKLFHWESQSTTSETSPTGKRYINHASQGIDVVLFVRERAKGPTGATSPYACLGAAKYVEHRGEQPMAITWELRTPMRQALFEAARAVAA